MTGVTVRPAVPDDLEAVTAVFLDCWRVSYRGVLPGEAIETMHEGRARELWTRALPTQPDRVLIAEGDDGVLGVTRYSLDGSTGMIDSLYVSPTAQGRGVGGRLLRAAAAALRDEGASTVRLWVFAVNEEAVAFYARHGWFADGEQRTQEEFGLLELRLERSVESL